MNLHDRLKEMREKKGLSQTAFAAIAGASKHAQINWEKGVATPNADALLAWAAIGVDIDYILSGVTATEKAMVVLGVAARLITLGYPPNTNPEAVMQLIKDHPEIDVMWLLSGQETQLEGALSSKEKVMVTNYRAASSEGKKALEVQAAFFAKNNEGTAALAAKSSKHKAA